MIKGSDKKVYQIGEYVVKANIGLCRIEEILHLEGTSIDKNRLYYLLIPLSDEKAKIYVPVESVSGIQRKALNSDEAWKLIDKISEIESINVVNEKLREKKYKEYIRSCNPKMWVGIIKTMYQRKQKRNAEGKKEMAVDEHYFRDAEYYLYSELAFAIGRDRKEISGLIAETIQKKDMNVKGH